jgi:hypothetical protein
MFRAPWEGTDDKGNWENADEWERRFSGKDAEADKAEVKAYQVARDADKAAADAKKAEAAKAAASEKANKAAARQANQDAQDQNNRYQEAAAAAAKQEAKAAEAAAAAAESDAQAQALSVAKQVEADKVAEDTAAAAFAAVSGFAVGATGDFLAKVLESNARLTPEQIETGMNAIEKPKKVTIKKDGVEQYEIDETLTQYTLRNNNILGCTGADKMWRYAEIFDIVK